MTSLSLTFAELAYLLRDGDPSARARLQLAEWPQDSPVLTAGLASLAVRGLLETRDGRPAPIEAIDPIIRTALNPTAWVEVGAARETAVGGLQLFDGAGRFVVTAALLDTFTIAPLDPAPPWVDVAVNFVLSALVGDDDVVVVVTLTPDADRRLPSIAIRRRAGMLETIDGEVATATTMPGVVAAIRDVIAAGAPAAD